jgi:hypothetical protein
MAMLTVVRLCVFAASLRCPLVLKLTYNVGILGTAQKAILPKKDFSFVETAVYGRQEVIW